MSYELLVQMAYLWTTNKGFTPCKGIQNSLALWSLRRVYRIPRYWIPVFVSETRFLELYSGFHKHFFSGFRIPQTKISWIPKSGCPYIRLREGSTIVFIFDVYSAQKGLFSVPSAIPLVLMYWYLNMLFVMLHNDSKKIEKENSHLTGPVWYFPGSLITV